MKRLLLMFVFLVLAAEARCKKHLEVTSHVETVSASAEKLRVVEMAEEKTETSIRDETHSQPIVTKRTTIIRVAATPTQPARDIERTVEQTIGPVDRVVTTDKATANEDAKRTDDDKVAKTETEADTHEVKDSAPAWSCLGMKVAAVVLAIAIVWLAMRWAMGGHLGAVLRWVIGRVRGP